MIEGQIQFQRVNFKFRLAKIWFLTNKRRNKCDTFLLSGEFITAQITSPDWTIPGYSLDYTLGIVWELPDYT